MTFHLTLMNLIIFNYDRKVMSIILFDVITLEQDSSSTIQGKFIRPRI